MTTTATTIVIRPTDLVATCDLEKLWEQFKQMVYSRCQSFYRSTKIAVEELIGVAKIKFMELVNKYADKTVLEFGKLLYISVTNSLKDFARKEFKKYELPEQYDEVWHQEYMRFEDIRSTLSEASRKLVDKVIEEEPTTRTDVVKIARKELHYSQPKVWKCMREIKQVLKQIR